MEIRFAFPDLKLVRHLAEAPEAPSVSLYLAPLRGDVPTANRARRLAQLLRDVGRLLERAGLATEEAERCLAPALPLTANGNLQEHPEDGLALFLRVGEARGVIVPHGGEEHLHVGPRFYLRPLLGLQLDPFHVLTLSQTGARLFDCTHGKVRKVELGDAASLELTLGAQKEPQNLGQHSGSRAGAGAGRMPAIVHGSGVGKQVAKSEGTQYLLRVAAVVDRHLAGHTASLVLAGVEHMVATYRHVARYPHIAPEALRGNFDDTPAVTLRDLAAPLALAPQREAAAHAVARFDTLHRRGRASGDLPTVLAAARSGRVETLLLDADSHVWGVFDTAHGEVRRHPAPAPGDDDLLDAAASWTLRHRGRVLTVAAQGLPSGVPVVGFFRY